MPDSLGQLADANLRDMPDEELAALAAAVRLDLGAAPGDIGVLSDAERVRNEIIRREEL